MKTDNPIILLIAAVAAVLLFPAVVFAFAHALIFLLAHPILFTAVSAALVTVYFSYKDDE